CSRSSSRTLSGPFVSKTQPAVPALRSAQETEDEQRPSSRGRSRARACPYSFIVCRQGGVEIELDTIDQRLESLNQTSIHGLQTLGVAGDVACQETQKLSEQRIVALGGLGAA